MDIGVPGTGKDKQVANTLCTATTKSFVTSVPLSSALLCDETHIQLCYVRLTYKLFEEKFNMNSCM